MDKKCHPTIYNWCNYLCLPGLKFNHVSKRGHRFFWDIITYPLRNNNYGLAKKSWHSPQFNTDGIIYPCLKFNGSVVSFSIIHCYLVVCHDQPSNYPLSILSWHWGAFRIVGPLWEGSPCRWPIIRRVVFLTWVTAKKKSRCWWFETPSHSPDVTLIDEEKTN